MKFQISSTLLSQNLQAISRVISNKNTLPILDYFLFEISGNSLTVTASDLETTLQTTLTIENLEGDGSVAIPAKRITDSIREFSEQPLTISIDKTSWECTINWRSGKLSIPGISSVGYPEGLSLSEECNSVDLTSEVIADGISNTIFATSSDPMRPVINGIFVELNEENITFVATDAFRVVKLENKTIKCANKASFILPQKPAQLLKSVLPKEGDAIVKLEFDAKNAIFTLANHRLVCRLIEGNFPNYNAVIPKGNDKVVTINRDELIGSIKRVSVCSNQASGLIQFSLSENNMNLTAQDVDFATSAEDNISCSYMGDALEIGFKSSLLKDLLEVIDTTEVKIELADQTKPGLFLPVDDDDSQQSILMLLMPMSVNA